MKEYNFENDKYTGNGFNRIKEKINLKIYENCLEINKKTYSYNVKSEKDENLGLTSQKVLKKESKKIEFENINSINIYTTPIHSFIFLIIIIFIITNYFTNIENFHKFGIQIGIISCFVGAFASAVFYIRGLANVYVQIKHNNVEIFEIPIYLDGDEENEIYFKCLKKDLEEIKSNIKVVDTRKRMFLMTILEVCTIMILAFLLSNI